MEHSQRRSHLRLNYFAHLHSPQGYESVSVVFAGLFGFLSAPPSSVLLAVSYTAVITFTIIIVHSLRW